MIGNISLCVECKACEQICPKKCISFSRTGKMIIEEANCIKCGLCHKVCQLEHKCESFSPIAVYAAIRKNEEKRMKSSSGGVASVFAEYILNVGGIVFGAAYNECLIPEIIPIEQESDLIKIQKSKYSYSDTNTSYSLCKKYCELGKLVLFIGLPCQIAGLKLFLGRNYDNLYLVDILCHGAPHYSILSNHLRYISQKKKRTVVDYQFRDKEHDKYGPYSYSLLLNDDTAEIGSCLWDAYYNHFLEGNICRNSCYNCEYASAERVGDISLGDFWKASHTIQELSNEKYISSIIVCNDKGIKLLESCKKDIILYESNITQLAHSTHAVECPVTRKEKIDIEEIKEYDNYSKWARKYELSLSVQLRKLKNSILSR